MEYKKEIDEIFNLLRDDWMNDKDFENYKEVVIEETGMTYEKISEDISVGVKNGYPAELQIQMVQTILEQMKED